MHTNIGAPLLLPGPRSAEVWIDFDGTLTQGDVVDGLIRSFAVTDHWRALEADWQAGRIGSQACLAGQFDLVRIADDELEAFLDSVSLDPGAPSLLNMLRGWRVPVTILSDGIDWFIDRILRAGGVEPPPIRSNRLVRAEETLRLECPHQSAACSSAAAHCKCASLAALETAGTRRVYIGDGQSDLCVARKAHVRFAKGVLATRLTDEGLPFIPFRTLHDVCMILDACWTQSDRRVA